MAEPSVDQTDIAERVFNVVEAIVEASEGFSCEYEYLPADAKELPCVMMQTLTGPPLEKTYLDGSYVANYRFALYLRQADADTQARLDARGILNSLAEAVMASTIDLGEGCSMWSLRKENLPSRMQADEGYIDYQVTLALKYKALR